MHRTELANCLCDEMGFADPRGRRQLSGCLKALRVLEKRGHFVLPVPRTKPGQSRPRRLESEVPIPQDVPTTAGLVRELQLVLVETEDHVRVWNTMLQDEHPRGAGPLVGRQLRYLIGSEHGWLGGIGFASAALHLDARDRWIGWNLETRQAYLERVVGMSRFLIRPSVRCKNLASRILSMVTARVAQDFNARYGYEPWLIETFVDESLRGTCYQAANWIQIGSSRGRGRQDRDRARAVAVKQLYVWVLDNDFRARLPVPRCGSLKPLPWDSGLEPETWAEREFGGAPLGDQRRTRRLIRSATVMAESPMASFPGSVKGDKHVIKGHYRFIDQPDDSAVCMENILVPHREQTIRRMMAHKTVLCIQDGTDLNYSGVTNGIGLGVIGSNQTGAQSGGLHLHTTFAVNAEGLPLGVLYAQCGAPKTRSADETRKSSEISIEEKKTHSWFVGMSDCEAVATDIPDTHIVQVMDREADMFELFDAWRLGLKRTDLLVRAKVNRQTANELPLFDRLRAAEPRGDKFELVIDRQSARPKKSKQKARSARSGRTALMTLHYEHVELQPSKAHKGKKPISLWAVHLVEEDPPAGTKAVEWFLLSTMEVATPEQARTILDFYCFRWRIEDWHRVLKSGCGIEELRNDTAERLKRVIAIYMVIAWRIMLMALLGRELPELPAEVLFTDIELEVLHAYARTRRDVKPPTSLGHAVLLVGILGGHQARKGDPPPGHEVLWTGYSGLQLMCTGYLLSRDAPPAERARRTRKT